jgi:class 3 adenylate cyclase/pimeloyl-ACP methyl ester carboxylesterase
MTAEGADRRLAAIMFTDVVGYSALTERDEPGAIEIRERHRDLVRPLVARFQGQLIDATGDETLAVFPSSLMAVDCALAIQASLRDDPELKLRIGIHLGDILMREAEVAGEGVNIASRIRPLADPGGICVSGPVWELVRNRSYISARPLGSKSLKNVSQPVEVFALGTGPQQRAKRVDRRVAILVGCIALLAVGYGVYATNRAAIQSYLMLTLPRYIGNPIEQQIGFATTGDGVRIAYATTGQGPGLVLVVGWATHLERGLLSPMYDASDNIRWMSRRNLFVRYDGRGFGLSDRDVTDFSLDARVRDLEAVADALGLDRFSMLAISSGGPTAIAYAARHPQRVSRIVFLSAAVSWGPSPAQIREHPVITSEREWSAMLDLFRSGWESAVVRGTMADLLFPELSDARRRVIIEFLRISGSGAAVAEFHGTVGDATDLARRVEVPALVIHTEADPIVPLSYGRRLASLIPGAQLKIVDGYHTPSTPAVFEAISSFLAEDQPIPRGSGIE